MPQTNYLDDPSHPGTCLNCHQAKTPHHSGERFGQAGDVCDRSRAYVWRTLREKDVPVMEAALTQLRTFTMGKDADLRIVARGATGDDSWAHAYGYDEEGRKGPTHAAIMEGWAAEYRGTLEKMATAWEFFEHGWWARHAVPAKVDLKHESAWVLCMGTLTSYVLYKGEVKAPHFSTGPISRALTPDIELAHSFRSRKEALDCLQLHRKWTGEALQESWDPRVGRRAELR